jgi:glycosyltransferase involved in cell wall biosynthesis
MGLLVSCVLTFSNRLRLNLARKAVNNFIYQRYTPYELLIVNGTDQSVLTNDEMQSEEYIRAGCTVKEIKAESGLNAAQMRNIGLLQAKGSYAICIDDDDYFHPDRLLYQMSHRFHETCMLKYQLRLDLSSVLYATPVDGLGEQPAVPGMHLLAREQGIPCTILFPRVGANNEPWLFDEALSTGEYEEFVARLCWHYGPCSVFDNSHTPFNQADQLPLLSVAMYHGFNELKHMDFFAKTELQSNSADKLVGLNQYDMEHVKFVLRSYNFQVN